MEGEQLVVLNTKLTYIMSLSYTLGDKAEAAWTWAGGWSRGLAPRSPPGISSSPGPAVAPGFVVEAH